MVPEKWQIRIEKQTSTCWQVSSQESWEIDLHQALEAAGRSAISGLWPSSEAACYWFRYHWTMDRNAQLMHLVLRTPHAAGRR